jgi:hypothetical protein
MRTLAESEHAPEELHQQVQALLDGRATIQHRRRRLWAGVAAAIILLAMAGYGLKWYHAERWLTPNRLAREFIVDHLNYLPGREQIVSDSAQDVQQWFRGAWTFRSVSLSFPPPRWRMHGSARSQGGRRRCCIIDASPMIPWSPFS